MSSFLTFGRRSLPHRAVILSIVLAVFAAVLLFDIGAAEAIRVPDTLADRRTVQTGPVTPGFPIDYLGVLWDTPDDNGSISGQTHGVGSHGAVRFRHDGRWGSWISLVEDGAEAPGQWGSGLIPASDADAYQVRGLPTGAVNHRAVALNTTDGPLVTVGVRPSGAASALTNCLSRAEWGADESLRFSDGVTEDWPAEFEPVQAMTVHHTVTVNDDPDPAATMRAIYRYHTVDREWGDIAYQYLIDEQGRIYEGRWSGTESARCDAGGDGTDFAHNPEGLLVTGGHTAYHNQGNLGIALLGDFTDVMPKAMARSALESALAELAGRHDLDPLGIVDYYNAVWDTSNTVDTISGHRDWRATACPGDTFYPELPDVRLNVAALMGPTPPVADAGPDQSAFVDAPVAFDGSASADVDGTIVSYQWDFGDGSSGSGVAVSHVYASAGIYTATLTVTDDHAMTGQDSAVATITEVPVEIVTITDAIYDARKATLTIEALSTEGGAAVLTVEGFDVMAYDAKKDVYKLTLTVDSNPGSVTVTSSLGGTATAAVTEKGVRPPPNQPPIADAGPDQTIVIPEAGGSGSVTLDGSGSFDPDGAITAYEWFEGDTLLATGVAPVVPLEVGNHFITLTVTDDGAATASDTTLIGIVDPSAGITLTAIGYRVKGVQKADLDWLGATSDMVDIYRDDVVVATTENDGLFTDDIGNTAGASYSYRVCEASTGTCSNDSIVSF